ncbi:MAG: porin family protein [Rhizobiaceae bacterium]|nr:porin family protein [Rhizobiaceae bacterium]
MRHRFVLHILGFSIAWLAAGSTAGRSEPAFDWSGVYLGGAVGYGGGMTGNSWTNSGLYPRWEVDGDIAYRSWLGSIHAGVLQQVDRWAIGLEADYNWVGFSGDDSQFAGVVNGLELEHYGTARVRAGRVMGRSLFYGTGGVGFGEITKTDTSLNYDSVRAKVVGWAAGAGYERAFGQNWLARIEYQHIDLGEAVTTLQSALGSYSHRADGIRFDTVRVGVSYKF